MVVGALLYKSHQSTVPLFTRDLKVSNVTLNLSLLSEIVKTNGPTISTILCCGEYPGLSGMVCSSHNPMDSEDLFLIRSFVVFHR